ncbi:MFS transporter [Actinomadura sp. NBRC 104425]|uniref:MFS transporter n=1 Tax=Actinomadura sp. NBRC 104425 TaxID=3032204 RepID=UPI0024A02F78|nr:MFS transporter [Actinomadura sp. NBRC 104425]GLZ11011.1 MFS transporter [Actinomadura sp. NBRC 104425]
MVTQTAAGTLGRARLAVTVAFVAHGLIGSAWVARIPQVKEHLGLSEGGLGVALLGAPAGVVLAVRFAGAIVARWGSRATTMAAGAAAALALVPMGLAGNLGVLIAALLLFGGSLGLMDVAMNAQGVAVERRLDRPIMSGLHGAYSIGTLAAALVGSGLAHLDVPVQVHLSVAAAVLAALVLAGCQGLLDRSADEPPDTAGEDAPPGASPRKAGADAARGARRMLALLGFIGLCSFVGEGAVADWSAVYLRETLDAGAGVAGLAYAGFAVAMTAGRLAGDRVVARYGPVRVLRAGALISALGLGLGLAVGHPAAAIIGFTLFGIGIAPVAPVTFSAAGNLPGVPAARGISRVTAVGYLGLLGGPPVIGFVAQEVGLAGALCVPVALVAAILPSARATATAAR